MCLLLPVINWNEAAEVPIISFDIRCTYADVSQFDGNLDHTFSFSISDVSIQVPQVDINTVAAGGGSILLWKNGLFKDVKLEEANTPT